MSIHYFIVNKADVTRNIFNKSIQTNVYTIRKSMDGLKWILKFKDRDVPIELFNLGYSRLTSDQMREQIRNSGDW